MIQMHPFHFVAYCALTETVNKVVEWCYPLSLLLIQCIFDQVCSNNITVGLDVIFTEVEEISHMVIPQWVLLVTCKYYPKVKIQKRKPKCFPVRNLNNFISLSIAINCY